MAAALKDLMFFHASSPNISGQIIVIPNGLGLKAPKSHVSWVNSQVSQPEPRSGEVTGTVTGTSLTLHWKWPSIHLPTRIENSTYLNTLDIGIGICPNNIGWSENITPIPTIP